MHPFFRLLRLSLGESESLPRPLTADEWDDVLDLARRHTVIGLIYRAITLLPDDRRPKIEQLAKFYILSEKIRAKNALLNRRAAEVTKLFRDHGYRSCVLKGQAVALLYPDPATRQAGDIDLWVEGTKKDVLHFIQARITEPVTVEYHHADFPLFPDAEVEVHYIPALLHWPPAFLRILRYFRQTQEAQFSNVVSLPDGAGEIGVPTTPFNLVFSLAHIHKHFFSEGVGLRHVVDYYYILRQPLTEAERADVIKWLRRLGMYKFARAMMYVQQTVLGLPDDSLLCPPHEREGEFMMQQIMAGGNFRRAGNSKSFAGESRVHHLWRTMRDNACLFTHYPTAVMGFPLFCAWHYTWRRLHGYKGM